MDSERLRALQAPIKDRYRSEPAAALITLEASGRVDEPACTRQRAETERSLVQATCYCRRSSRAPA
jgi:hypothetical protein